ncbi:unnamed protein product [Prunus armeniaca]|uniref:Uncharacterized protein n=1 Tax=Prunus armeniaca TaxID=36596 RepID=A0A6J5XXY0_PRUAR|nr:unnamed protein product [Prunus armeniaca]
MAPKKVPATILDSSSSEETAALPDFLSSAGVMSFAVVFDNWVYRFAAGRVDFFLCKDLVSFVNDYCVLGPRYVDQKSDQLWNYETHPIQAPILVCHAEGIRLTLMGFERSNHCSHQPQCEGTLVYGANLVVVDFPEIKRSRPAYHLRFGPLERSNSELGVW